MKRIVLFFATLILTLSSLSGCSGKSGGRENYATEYKVLYPAEFTTLDYIATGNTNEYRVLANTIDGLIDYDKYGNTVPLLAERWNADEDYTIWTFEIRQGVKWVDKDSAEVAEVTAQDWVDAARHSNEARTNSSNQYMYEFVRNAMDYYDQSGVILEAENAVQDGAAANVEEYFAVNGVDPASFITFDDVGVRAVSTYILEYTMESPCPFFLSCLSYNSYMPVYGPFLEEQGTNFGIDNESLLFNGAYILSEFEPNVKRTLTKNASYWDSGNVTIEKISYIFNADEVTLAPTMAKNGEIDVAYISADILDAWMASADTKDLVRPSKPDISFSYFYNFNFEPRFNAAFEPENWVIAVNNENFRKSLFYGLDRIKALTVKDPYNPQMLVNNSVTPVAFAATDGKDYTSFRALADISARDSFNSERALSFKEAAIPELEAAGATFPIKILMPFNPGITGWEQESQVVEQQLEALLGSDYIDIIVEAGPVTGFLSEVRRSGKYAFMKCNWGADFADPQTWAEPFSYGNSYGFFYTDADNMLGDKPRSSKTASTQALAAEYYGLVDIAKSAVSDIGERYEAFSKAEAFIIEHAFFIPFSVDSNGYTVDRIDPFTVPSSPFGVSQFRFKGVSLLDKPMSASEFEAAYTKWQSEWKAEQK
ncbi:MAG: ABC transporter substrate-binding protein [Eubacteriaceae bacterium]|nr:ABC transporter substrate-binding protein [Eubacteriaceae bacterium]